MAFREVLENGLIFRTVENEKDIVRYIEFNSKFNNPYEGATCKNLLLNHPHINLEEFQLIEDERMDGIVSTTCLIPWQCVFEDIPMKAAMLELILSHPDYRKAGLVRIQMNRLQKLVEDGGYDISFIWGIPYYYRQYGYTYCINGNTADILPAGCIPACVDVNGGTYGLRKAEEEDIEELTHLYTAANEHQQFHITRDEVFWRFFIKHSKAPVWLVVNKSNGKSEGYIVCGNHEDKCIHISENSIANEEAGMAVLQLLNSEKTKEIVISWPENNVLVKLARSFGSIKQQPGQWLVRIHDLPRVLTKIRKVLEKRIAESSCAGVTQDIIINLFRQAYKLKIIDGKLTSVDSLGFVDSSMGADGGDLCIPTDAFVRLFFGFRSLDRLFDAWPDIVVKHESRYLLEVLFPEMTSYLNAPFSYYGAL